jgi:hypothetical protein
MKNWKIIGCLSFLIIGFLLMSGCMSSGPTNTVSETSQTTKCALPSSVGDSSSQTITQSYPYNVNGQKGSIELTLNKQLSDYFACRSDEIGPSKTIQKNTTTCFLGSCKSSNLTTRVDRPMELINESKKYSALKPLIDAIKSKSTDPSMQARIAINLVQHIPPNCSKDKFITASNYQSNAHFSSPYEVLYENTGICTDKSALLASLLNDLGYESAYIEFYDTDMHAMAGIGGSGNDQYQNTGFILIETTNPFPIGFVSKDIEHPMTNLLKLSGGSKFYLNNQDHLDIERVYVTNDFNQRYGYQTAC